MKSAKLRFQRSLQDVEWHQALVASRPFEIASDAAMLEVANTSFKDAAFYGIVMIGAKLYQQKFASLSEVATAPKKDESLEIDYTKT